MNLEMWSNDDSQTYCVKGHVDINAFKSAIEKEEIEVWGDNRFKDADVEHGWFKAVPDKSGDYHCIYHPSNESIRGSFKATTATIY
jgi:hypothetical protein